MTHRFLPSDVQDTDALLVHLHQITDPDEDRILAVRVACVAEFTEELRDDREAVIDALAEDPVGLEILREVLLHYAHLTSPSPAALS